MKKKERDDNVELKVFVCLWEKKFNVILFSGVYIFVMPVEIK